MCILLLLSLSSPSFGQISNTIDQKEIVKIKNLLEKEGVPQDKQEQLIHKLVNNEVWDSFNPSKLELIPKDFFKLSNAETEKKFVFPDGSFIKIKITPGKVIPVSSSSDFESFSENGIRAFPDKTVIGHLFEYSFAIANMSYKLDFILRDFNRSEILSYAPYALYVYSAGDIIDTTSEVSRRYETSTYPATAYGRCNIKLNNNIYTITLFAQIANYSTSAWGIQTVSY